MRAEKKSIAFISALIMGAIVFIFQVLLNRWLSVALGATVSNQLAILLSTYIFFGLGAYFSNYFKSKKMISHIILMLALMLLAYSWPSLPLWVGSILMGHELRFILTILIIAPFFLMFGMAIPQFTGQKNKVRFSQIYFWFHLGAALFLMFWDFFLIVRLGVKFSLFVLGFLCLTLIILDFFNEEEPKVCEPEEKNSWNKELLGYSLLNGVVQGFLLYFNNRVQGPFSISFTSYLVTSMIAIALASIWVEKKSLRKEGYKSIIINLLPLAVLWCLAFGFLIPYFYEVMASESIVIQKLLRFCVVLIQFLPSLFLMALLVPAYVESKSKDYLVLSQNAWGNVLGILSFLGLMTMFSNAKLVLMIIIFTSIILISLKRFFKRLVFIFSLLILVIFLPTAYLHSSFRYFENSHMFWNELMSGDLVRSKNFLGSQVDILDLSKGKTLIIDGYKSVHFKNTKTQDSHERLLGKYQNLLVKNKKEALILGVGSEATVASLAESFDKVIGVEIHPIIYNLRDVLDYEFSSLKKTHNYQKVFDDGHSFLRQTKRKFDLIVNNVPTPQFSPASILWTKEFYEEMREKLHKNGIYSQWVDGAINDDALNVILSTMQESFTRCYFAAITSTYGNIICSNDDKELFKEIHPLVFPIRNWEKINFLARQNTLSFPYLEHELSPFLSQSWDKKKDWFLFEKLGIQGEDVSRESCLELSKLKSKIQKQPLFCEKPVL